MTNTVQEYRRGAIPWLDWGAAPFARAREERKAVLLNIGARWCHGCAVMERTTYADEGVVASVLDRFVPVRVDADRRPDVNERYNLEGWPTTVFLTPTGEMLAGSTYLTTDAFARLAAEVSQAMEHDYETLMARADEQAAHRRRTRAPATRYEPDPAAADWMARHLVAQHDREHGGFGTGGKFLQASALGFAVARARATGDEQLAAVAISSLEDMLRSPIVDDVEGGFFRYAAGRDWSRPHTEKMLEDQAAMLRVLVAAADAFDRPDFGEQARRLMGFVRRSLADRAVPAFFASQAADEEYYTLSGSLRDTLGAPAIDRTLFTDLNAQAAGAWIEAGVRLDDTDAIRFGATALDRVLSASYRPGEGVAHYDDRGPQGRGLLTDQVHAAWAALDLCDVTGDETWWMVAEELLRYAMRVCWDEAAGFLDRAPGGDDEVGLLRDPVRPLGLNCLAARALSRLARLTGKDDLRLVALRALGGQTAVYRTQGVAGAPYATAVLELMNG